MLSSATCSSEGKPISTHSFVYANRKKAKHPCKIKMKLFF
jgi:hypothetical protein